MGKVCALVQLWLIPRSNYRNVLHTREISQRDVNIKWHFNTDTPQDFLSIFDPINQNYDLKIVTFYCHILYMMDDS